MTDTDGNGDSGDIGYCHGEMEPENERIQMGIITSARLIELGKIAAQGLMKYWLERRQAKALKRAEADSVRRWLRDENRCHDLNAAMRNRAVKQTDYIDLTPQGLKAIKNEGKSEKADR